MPKPIIVEGQTATNPQTGEKIVYKAGKWFPVNTSATAAPADTPLDPLTPGADGRVRVAMGLGPAIEAQKQMFRSEGWNKNPKSPSGINPYNEDWGATNLSLSAEGDGAKKTILGYDKQALARQWGGEDFQAYDQAAKSWEASMLPILSGAAVTPSEAQRQLRANLPQLGDSPHILSKKAVNRAMMTNAAADLVGRPRPFPKIGTWKWEGGSQDQARPQGPQPAPQAQGQGWKVLSVE